jgi:hypothetical protein
VPSGRGNAHDRPWFSFADAPVVPQEGANGLARRCSSSSPLPSRPSHHTAIAARLEALDRPKEADSAHRKGTRACGCH